MSEVTGEWVVLGTQGGVEIVVDRGSGPRTVAYMASKNKGEQLATAYLMAASKKMKAFIAMIAKGCYDDLPGSLNADAETILETTQPPSTEVKPIPGVQNR